MVAVYVESRAGLTVAEPFLYRCDGLASGAGKLNSGLMTPWLEFALKATSSLEAAMFAFVKSIWKNQTGATAIEYGFIVALVVIGIVSAVINIGARTSTTFNTIATKL